MRFPIRFFPENTSFGFMRFRWVGFVISFLLIAASIGLFVEKGLTLGIDFTGGVLMEIRAEEPVELAPLRELLGSGEFGEVSLQHFGDEQEVLIRIQAQEEASQAEIVRLVKEKLNGMFGESLDYRKVDFVGPTVGEELVYSAYLSLGIAFVAILLYVWFRFEWQFGLGAIIALFHDSILMVGFYVYSGFDFGLTSVAAILTIIGYSINDSVVIYDRIRENMRKFKQMALPEILDRSINETLSRTILTAGTTIMAAAALALFGGEIIKGFSVALLFGVVAGTYSSIFISAPVLLYFNVDSLGGESQAAAEA